jgi:hypothetical protein
MISCQILRVRTNCSNIMLPSRALALDALRAMPSMLPSKLLNTRTSESDLCRWLGKVLLRMACPGSRTTISHNHPQHFKDHIHRWAPATSPSLQKLPQYLVRSPKALRCLIFHTLRRTRMTISPCTPFTTHHPAVSSHLRLLAHHPQQGIPEARMRSKMVRIYCCT